MAKKPLKKGCQKAPPVEAKTKGLWPPKDGTAYRVKDGDNWMDLAKDWKVDVRHLIGFNFNTVTPEEVNWYLDRYVGCVERTADCYNWRFSSAADPGIIYKPPPGYPYKDPGDPVYPGGWDPDPPIEIKLPEVTTTTDFSIRMGWSFGAGKAILAFDLIIFEIRNNNTLDTALYRYTGVGPGAGIIPVSFSLGGKWNHFSTSKPILETDFEGITRFITGAGPTMSSNELHLHGTPPGVDSVYLRDFKMGFTVSASSSNTAGELVLKEK